jgi:hypothetical protein
MVKIKITKKLIKNVPICLRLQQQKTNQKRFSYASDYKNTYMD